MRVVLILLAALFSLVTRLCDGFSLLQSSFTTSSKTVIASRHNADNARRHRRHVGSPSFALVMRDASASYWFRVGDSVRVVDDVLKAGSNLNGRIGTVVETWEKCDVDPTCCCAEQVNPEMAVRVRFQGTEKQASASGEGSFYHYFAEEELVKIRSEEEQISEPVVPFDGMSCVAFKMDQLKIDEKPRHIASYDPNAPRTDI